MMGIDADLKAGGCRAVDALKTRVENLERKGETASAPPKPEEPTHPPLVDHISSINLRLAEIEKGVRYIDDALSDAENETADRIITKRLESGECPVCCDSEGHAKGCSLLDMPCFCDECGGVRAEGKEQTDGRNDN